MLAFAHGHGQLLTHDVQARVVGQLQVVDARHHRRQKVVGLLVRLQRLAHHRQRWRQALETWRFKQKKLISNRYFFKVPWPQRRFASALVR